MGMILACERDDNTLLYDPEGQFIGLNVKYIGEYRELIPLYCPECRCATWVERTAVEKDGDIWRYKI